MKPLVLKMKAFGPYAEETIVSFDQLNNGLFLITGDTGAGKTTIFDAMVFALYGEGSGTNRDAKMFHSDYVSKSIDTEVTFTFEHSGQMYEIYRTIHYTKNQKTKEYSEKPGTGKQHLKAENGEVIEKDITPKVQELIGLNPKQFRQIVMLAQGEFQAFLRASNTEKKQILGNLFDSSAYVSFQKRLDEAEKLLTKKNEQLNIKLSGAINMDNFPLPEDMDELDKNKFHPNHPSIIENLEHLIANEVGEIKVLDDTISQLNDLIQKLTTRIEGAQTKNNELKLLDDFIAKKGLLESRKVTMDEMKHKLEQAKVAYRKVYPEEKDYLRINEDYLRANRLFVANQQNLDDKEKELEVKKNEVNSHQYLLEQIQNIDIQLKDVEEHLNSGDYDRLFELTSQTNKLEKSLLSLESEVKTLEIQMQSITSLIDSNKIEMTKLEELDSTSDVCYQVYTDTKNQLGIVEEYVKQVDQLIREESDYQSSLDKHKELELEALALHDDYSQKYKLFISGQASIIAQSVVNELEEKGETYCPVCKTHLVSSDCSRLASGVSNVCTQEDVDQAKEAFDTKEEQRRKEHVKVETLKTRIEQMKLLCNGQIEKLKLSVSEEAYTKDYALQVKSVIQNDYNEAYIQYQKVLKAKEQFNLLKQKQTQLETELQNIKNTLKEKEKNKQTSDIEYTKVNAECQALVAKLPEPSKEAAQRKIVALEKDKKALELQYEKFVKARDKVNNEVQQLRGTLQVNESQVEELSSKLSQANEAYQNILNECFDSEAMYRMSLAYINDLNYAEALIKSQDDQFTQYQHDVSDNLKRIEEQQAKTQGFVKEDTDVLLEQLKTYKDDLSSKEKVRIKLIGDKNIHQNACDNIKKYQDDINKIKPAFRRIQRLNDVANAKSNTEGGKYNFESYSLANTFKEILQAANVRLNRMSGGKYELVHETKTIRKNSEAGFDIKVLDAFTNEIRDSGSLSGGETFEVSMSLALGLSDVVQAHANGKKIDAIFIDEGFGSLDESLLIKAKNVLEDIAGNSKQIGIISHVSKLDEVISQKIIVTGSNKGSKIKITK